MSAIQRLDQWIEILEAQPQNTNVELCATEVLHLLFDLRAARNELPTIRVDKPHEQPVPVSSHRDWYLF